MGEKKRAEPKTAGDDLSRYWLNWQWGMFLSSTFALSIWQM
jgi:hypothetical protein